MKINMPYSLQCKHKEILIVPHPPVPVFAANACCPTLHPNLLDRGLTWWNDKYYVQIIPNNDIKYIRYWSHWGNVFRESRQMQGFSVLSKNTSTCSMEGLGIKPFTLGLVDNHFTYWATYHPTYIFYNIYQEFLMHIIYINWRTCCFLKQV